MIAGLGLAIKMTTKNEQKWNKKIRKGDEQAFERLFKAYYFRLSRFVWRYVNSEAIAEELVQAVFADIWENRAEWQPKNTKTYLFSAVKNRAISYLRHQQVRNKYDSQWMDRKEYATIDIDDQVRTKQIQNAIKTEVEALPSRSKMTFKLHRYDGLTYKEISEVMDVSVKTVESQMTRTLKRLRKRLSYLLET
jgi:RNA polymerase sigma-70 factor (ECF subfamily)